MGAKVIDSTFMNSFVSSAIEVLKVQGGLPVRAGQHYIKGKGIKARPVSVVAQIGLASPTFKVAISMCYEASVFCKIVSHMFGEEVTEVTGESQDAAAELLNIVYGAVKTALNSQGYDFVMAIPTVSRGADVQISYGDRPTLVVPLASDYGFIYVEVAATQ